MTVSSEEFHDLAKHCQTCHEETRDNLSAFDRRLLALEIVVRGEDGRNGMKSQLNKLCDRFDQFEKKGIRLIAIGTALPGIVVAVLGVLKFIGKL